MRQPPRRRIDVGRPERVEPRARRHRPRRQPELRPLRIASAAGRLEQHAAAAAHRLRDAQRIATERIEVELADAGRRAALRYRGREVQGAVLLPAARAQRRRRRGGRLTGAVLRVPRLGQLVHQFGLDLFHHLGVLGQHLLEGAAAPRHQAAAELDGGGGALVDAHEVDEDGVGEARGLEQVEAALVEVAEGVRVAPAGRQGLALGLVAVEDLGLAEADALEAVGDEHQWEEFLARKPVQGVNHPDDDTALEEAKRTIGDYKLKSDPTYRAAKDVRETTVKKYKELLLSRRSQSDIRTDFNKKVYNLREEKLKIREELDRFRNKLEEIHDEIPQDQRRQPPIVRESEDAEFPERNFEIDVVLELDEDQKEKKVVKKTIVVGPTDLDHRERDVLPKNTKKFDAKDPGDVAGLDFETLCGFSQNQKKDTFWESDVRNRRLARKLFEQDRIIDSMDQKIVDFDRHLMNLNNERFAVETNAKVMDLFMVTLQQELIILKEFEALEDTLQAKVNQRISEVLDMRDAIDELGLQIDEKTKAIDKSQERIKSLVSTFHQATSDNKFYDFLRKVFRKKYKPPKIKKDDESSSESSSSTSSSTESEEDAKSIDSRDFGLIRQDLNVCPKGCDPAIYDYTVKHRSERHKFEILITEDLKTIEILKKDLEIHTKKVKLIEKNLQASQEELEKYQREKQDKLNEVRCVVVLKLHQIEHLTPENKRSPILRTLVFSKSRLSELYKRVDELQNETERQINRHQLNVRHYTRMHTDCEYMKRRIKQLQEVIGHCMKIKFGKMVDINEIEEAMLKRTFGQDDLHDLEEVLLKKIVHDLRLSMMDIKGVYMNDLHLWRDAIVRTQKELTYALRYNTSQQELLTYLVKEKSELAHVLVNQEKKKQHLVCVEESMMRHNEECDKLHKIIVEQDQQIRELREEIRTLRTKGMVLKPKETKREAAEEEETKLWDLKDLEVEEDEETGEGAKRKPFSTEIVIPTTLHEKSQEVAGELVQELLDALDVQLSMTSKERLVENVLASVRGGSSVADLVDELVRNLPIEPDEAQKSLIESAVGQLYVVGEPNDVAEEEECWAREVMEDIVDEVLLEKGEAKGVIARMIDRLVDELPMEFLRRKSSIEYVVSKLLQAKLDAELHQVDVVHMVHTKEAREILEGIIETVFDTGVDLMYYFEEH